MKPIVISPDDLEKARRLNYNITFKVTRRGLRINGFEHLGIFSPSAKDAIVNQLCPRIAKPRTWHAIRIGPAPESVPTQVVERCWETRRNRSGGTHCVGCWEYLENVALGQMRCPHCNEILDVKENYSRVYD